MFTKLALLAFVAPLVSALTLQVPTNPTTGGTVTINWTATQDDTSFSLFLVNDAFHDTFGIANNVDPSKQTLTLNLPSVPVRDGYELRATNVGNITDVFSNSGTFSIGAATVSSTATVTSSSATGTGATSTTAGATTRPVTSSSSFGVIVSSSATSGASAASSGASSASSAASSASNPAATGNAAVSVNAGGFVAMLLSVIAGAAVAL